MAARAPRDWSVEGLVKKRSVGDFPHFIDAETLERITPSCAAFVDLSRDEGLPYGFVSRFTGKPCPTIHKKDREIWTNSYYPSFWAAEQVSQGVCKALDALKIFA
jgi:hypothetical protein